MPRIDIPQRAFTGGILDPSLTGRDDLDVYPISVADMRNMDVEIQCGVKLRPGLAYIGPHRGQTSRLDLTSASLTPGTNTTGGAPLTLDGDPPDDPPVRADMSGGAV